MIQKQIIVTILCLTLTFTASSFAASESSPLLPILTAHRELISGVGSLEMVTKHGKELVDATFKMMADPQNKKFLNSPDGIELQKHHQMLTNFLAVKNHFEKCIKDKNSKRRLNERILESSFQNMTKHEDAALPCFASNAGLNQSYLDFNNGVMKAMKSMVKPDFQNKLSKQVMTNTAKSLLAFRQKFKLGFMRQGYLTQPDMNEVLNDVCLKKSTQTRGTVFSTDVCSSMDPKFKMKLAQDLIDFSKSQKNEKFTPEKATASLNSAIDRLNTSLSKITVTKNIGYIYDSADMTKENTKKDFDKYVNQYMSEVSKDAGPLFLTKTIKDEAGSIKRFKSDDTEKNRKAARFQFTKHKKVKLDDVKTSIKEVEEKIMNQAKDTVDMAFIATKVKDKLTSKDDDINDLVKINPFAAGQVALHNPEYAGLICDAINNINKNDVDDANFDRYFTVGTAVLGGALLLTGVGTVAGAYLITGSLTAGVAAGTLGGSILGYSAIAGTAMELSNLGHYSKKSYNSYQDMNRLEAAYLTQNADAESVMEAKNALMEFKDARFSAGMALMNVGLNLMTVGSLFNIVKASEAKVSPDQIKAAAKIMKYLSKTATARKLKDIAKVMGDKGMEKIDAFLLALAKVGEKNRVKFLELLNDVKMTPEKIKEIIESALDAAKNCSKI
ncbi:MAG: hypothetical protein H7336_09095 [Bacteriovorax sp.]|nr:hypothetical protein [Bacteriovorax sp.]